MHTMRQWWGELVWLSSSRLIVQVLVCGGGVQDLKKPREAG
jgi:hypothetical protein